MELLMDVLTVFGLFFVGLIGFGVVALINETLRTRKNWRRDMEERMAMLERQMRYVPLERRSTPDEADDKEGH